MIRILRKLPFLALMLGFALPTFGATLLIGNKTDHTVDLVDTQTLQSQATLATGLAPHEIAVSPDGSEAIVSDYGPRGNPGSTLTLLSIPEAKVLRTIDISPHERPHGVVWFDEDRVTVTTEGSRHLLVVVPSTGKIDRAIATDQEISHMVSVTPDGERAFVANIGSGSVTAIDLSEGRKIRDIATGEGAEGIAITPDGKEVWVANRGADTLVVIDASTLEILGRLPSPGFPIRIAMTPDGSRALVSCADSAEIALFDVGARKELLRRKLDFSTVPDAASRLFGDRFGDSPVPVGLVISPDGQRAWVAVTQADVVVVLDPESLEIGDLIRAGKEPDGMAFSPKEVQIDPAGES